MEPDLSQGQTCPSTSRLNLSNQFRARSVSQLEVSKSLRLEVCHGRRYLSGSSIDIFARVKKVGSAVIRDERWGAHYTILCNLSKTAPNFDDSILTAPMILWCKETKVAVGCFSSVKIIKTFFEAWHGCCLHSMH